MNEENTTTDPTLESESLIVPAQVADAAVNDQITDAVTLRVDAPTAKAIGAIGSDEVVTTALAAAAVGLDIGAESLKQAYAQLDTLRGALENCRLYAAKRPKEEWARNILRFCEEAGCVGSPLRG